MSGQKLVLGKDLTPIPHTVPHTCATSHRPSNYSAFFPWGISWQAARWGEPHLLGHLRHWETFGHLTVFWIQVAPWMWPFLWVQMCRPNKIHLVTECSRRQGVSYANQWDEAGGSDEIKLGRLVGSDSSFPSAQAKQLKTSLGHGAGLQPAP